MTWDTAGNIINDAMTEVGLGSVADPYGSNDPNFRMARALLKSGGRALVRGWEWTHLRAEHTFTTVAGVSSYPFPTGFRNMMDQTAWNRTNRLPVGGPLSPQEWQYLKSRLTGVVFTVLFRPMNQVMEIYPDGANTPGGYQIAFEYTTYNWVDAPATVSPYSQWTQQRYTVGEKVCNENGLGGGYWECTTADNADPDADGAPWRQLAGATPYPGLVVDPGWGGAWTYRQFPVTDAPNAVGDVVMFDPHLMSRRLKRDFLAAKKLDTTSAEREYQIALEAAKGDNINSPVLTAGRPRQIDPLIGGHSIPFTGFGS